MERLRTPYPGSPDLKKVAEGEGAVSRRLDVDDPRLASVHVQPVQAIRGAAKVGGDGHSLALIEDLQQRVVLHLRVLEPVARDGARLFVAFRRGAGRGREDGARA